MAGYYPIIEVQREWVLDQEPLGGKAKFWFRLPEGPESYLFKYPRENTGEHWAEVIAGQVARLLKIPHVPVGLATFQETHGTASESFIKPGQQLFHGNQILVLHLENYGLASGFGQSKHTLKNIWLALERVFEEPLPQKRTFTEFLVLDAVIGNTDRHHENWGVIKQREGNHWVGHLAPSFDHASSLGRELRDNRREGLLANNRIGSYSEKGNGGIYWAESDRKAPSPLELVRLVYSECPSLLTPALSKLESLNEEALSDIVGRIPPDWMTQPERRFAIELLCYNCQQLDLLLRE